LTDVHKEFVVFETDVSPDSDKVHILSPDKINELIKIKEDIHVSENKE
jgi:hypothetical protein